MRQQEQEVTRQGTQDKEIKHDLSLRWLNEQRLKSTTFKTCKDVIHSHITTLTVLRLCEVGGFTHNQWSSNTTAIPL